MKTYNIVVRTAAAVMFPDTVHVVDAETVLEAMGKARLESEQAAKELLKMSGVTVDFDGDCIDIW